MTARGAGAAGALFVLTTISAGPLHAETPAQTLAGSDTLEAMTRAALATCGVPLVSYPTSNQSDTSTSAAQAALVAFTQEIAPMTRPIDLAVVPVGSNVTGPTSCKTLALEASVIVGHPVSNATAGCGGVATAPTCFNVTDVNNSGGGADCLGTTCPGASYCFDGPLDVLRLVYAGVENDGSVDCNGDVRRSLVDRWNTLFGAACAAGACVAATPAVLPASPPGYPPPATSFSISTTMPNLPVSFAQNGGVRRVLRRGDTASPTDTFLRVLGLPEVTRPLVTSPSLNPFCNGTDQQDGDPIRRRCQTADVVCGPNVHMGLVQAVVVPNRPVSVAYPTRSCTPGVFRLLPAQRIVRPNFTLHFNCPEREGFSVAGFCFTPVVFPSTQALTNPSGDADCWSAPQGVGPTFTDGRVTNRFLRAPDGTIITDPPSVGPGYPPLNPVTNAWYRVRSNVVVPGPPGSQSTLGAALCQHTSSKDQLGCLMGQLTCSLGQAPAHSGCGTISNGVGAGLALSIASVTPTTAAIQAHVNPVLAPTPYALVNELRECYFGTFPPPGTTAWELSVDSCLTTAGAMSGCAGAVQQNDFVEIPTYPSPVELFP